MEETGAAGDNGYLKRWASLDLQTRKTREVPCAQGK